MEIQTDRNGFKYYDSLPPGWRKAELNDFFDRENRFVKNKPFLVFGSYLKNFECYRTTTRESFEKLKYWIDLGNVYVLEG